jgi:hypothetical protein
MDNDLAPSGDAYTYTLLSKWEQIMEQAEEYRRSMLLNREDPHTQINFIAKLTRLWLELRPKVEGREEFGDLETAFMSFEQYYNDPTLLLTPGHADDILKLETMLRAVIERLGITRFEGKK